MSIEFVLNGQGSGDIASFLLANDFDLGIMRPWVGEDGRSYIMRNGSPVVTNAPSTLRHEEWISFDLAVTKAARERLRFVADLRGAGLVHNIPNGMASTVLQTETQSDAHSAEISLDGKRRGSGDRQEFEVNLLPLPIIHSDFSFSARQVAVSRKGSTPLDTSASEMAGRRVAEEIEKLTLGVLPTFTFGGGSIFGVTNHPDINVKTMTAPTSSNHATTVNEVLDMKTLSQDAFHFGPWMLYVSTTWDEFLDEDYSTAKGDNTLRDRLKKIDGIQDVRTLDFLPAKKMVLVQMTSDVARMVIGMDITTVRWETMGGMELNWKVLAIIIPQFRSDFNKRMGVVVGTHS